jgi:hypothetical protein
MFVLQICSALPIQETNYVPYGSANAIGFVIVHIVQLARRIEGVKWSKNDKTSPVNSAVTSGNGNKEIYRESTRSNWKWPQIIATVPDRKSNTVSYPTHLFFRYYLPLQFFKENFLVQEDPEEETYDQEQEEESREAESFQSYIAGHQDKISKKVQQQRAAIHKTENT